jgi:large subunit ribosomal protein L15
MKLSELSPADGSNKAKKRVGRGPGSGTGKTSGRGHKGQKSRSGYSGRIGFEGGQMPLIRKIPKRGFTNIFRTEFTVINVGALEGFEGEVTPESLRSHGLIRARLKVKVLGSGELTTALTVKADAFSKSAREKIEAAGGRCEELGS